MEWDWFPIQRLTSLATYQLQDKAMHCGEFKFRLGLGFPLAKCMDHRSNRVKKRQSIVRFCLKHDLFAANVINGKITQQCREVTAEKEST